MRNHSCDERADLDIWMKMHHLLYSKAENIEVPRHCRTGGDGSIHSVAVSAHDLGVTVDASVDDDRTKHTFFLVMGMSTIGCVPVMSCTVVMHP